MKFLTKKFDPNSLKVRLTLGMTLFTSLGLGGLSIWISMRMQQILVSSHKENIIYIAERFPQDVEIYSEMGTLEEGVQKAIDNLSLQNIVLWVKSDRGAITARSSNLRNSQIARVLLPLDNVPTIPQVQDLNGGYWLLCATPLEAKQVNLGQFYIAQDVTEDRKMLLRLLRNLSIATVIVTATTIAVIAFYINRSLQPLKKIGQVSSRISADRLGEAHIDLENPPTEVKELAITFQEMLSRLSESWEHQRQLLNDVSHELRTPLTIVCGYLESTLRRGNNLTEIQKEALTTAASEADRTVQLLQDLLDLARADSGTIHFRLEVVDVNRLINEILTITEQYSQHQIIFKPAVSNLEVSADRNRLKQVLLNLIDNAIKYSSEENSITVESYAENSTVCIAISDRGVGIPLAQQTRIFERFYRVDEARNRAGGTGLGLAIVKTIVEGMGGKISVCSQPGKGSTFTIALKKRSS